MVPHINRRAALGSLSALGAATFGGGVAPLVARAAPPAATRSYDVWKSPTCGCCGDWIDHMKTSGWTARIHDTGNTAVRARLGVRPQYGSCHTAVVGGYAIEGHVPAEDIKALLRQAPDAIGLAVPGMPIGSPGMDGPAYGGRKQPYDVLLLTRDGGSRVFRRYA